jgi:hypothetical protein
MDDDRFPRVLLFLAFSGMVFFTQALRADTSDRAITHASAVGDSRSGTYRKDCAETVAKQVATRLHYVLGENAPFDSALVVCKASPVEQNVTLVAIAIKSADASNAGDFIPLDLDLLKMKSGDLSILNRLVQHGAFWADQADYIALKLDTAPYRIASGVRAFGIRWSSGNNSRESETLNLFVADGNSIREVLAFDTYNAEHVACQGDYTRNTLSIAASAHHGYSDLDVRSVRTDGSTDTQDCEGKQTQVRAVSKYSLRYDGLQYVAFQ